MSKHNNNNPDDLNTSFYEETKESINQGELSTTRLETIITTTKPESPIARSLNLLYTPIIFRRIKMSTISTSSLTLPESYNLKEAEN
jgi:hypothetical protein